MATFFLDDTVSVSLPFVNDYVTDQKKFKTEVFFIETIRPSKKGTGILLNTSAFIVFLFKNSKACKRVIEICEAYQGDSYYPLIVKTTDSDPFYQLGIDEESTGYYEVKKDDFLKSTSWSIGSVQSKEESSTPPVPHIPAKK